MHHLLFRALYKFMNNYSIDILIKMRNLRNILAITVSLF